MVKSLRIVNFGLGPIGCSIARLLLEKRGVNIVGAIDIDRNRVGKDLGDVIGANRKLGVKVSDDAAKTLKKTKPDVVVHCTSSYLKVILPQLRQIMAAGADVVSTAEELMYPFYTNPTIARQIDRLAKKNKVTVLGTGINPGFVMDTLAVAMTAVTQRVEAIEATRIVDVSKRRLPLQKKVGVNLTVEEFNRKAATSMFGHVGLPESVALTAAGVGWKLEDTRQSIEPVVAQTTLKTEYFSIEPGKVAGLKQSAQGYVGGKERIQLNLQMSVNPENPHDAVHIIGTPEINLAIHGGVHGDVATAAIVVNMIPKVATAVPGLVTMKDLPLPSIFHR